MNLADIARAETASVYGRPCRSQHSYESLNAEAALIQRALRTPGRGKQERIEQAIANGRSRAWMLANLDVTDDEITWTWQQMEEINHAEDTVIPRKRGSGA